MKLPTLMDEPNFCRGDSNINWDVCKPCTTDVLDLPVLPLSTYQCQAGGGGRQGIGQEFD